MPIAMEAFAPPPIDTPPGSCFHHSDFPVPFEFPLDVEWLLFDPGAAPPTFLTTVDNPELTPFLQPPGNIVESFVFPFFAATVVLGDDLSLGTLTLLVEGSSELDSDSDSASDANSASTAVLLPAFVEEMAAEDVVEALRDG